MKRVIMSSAEPEFESELQKCNANASEDLTDRKQVAKWLLSQLKAAGIDTTKHKYKWTYEDAGGYKEAKTFYAPGDWVASFALRGYVPTIDKMIEYWWDEDEFVDDMKEAISGYMHTVEDAVDAHVEHLPEVFNQTDSLKNLDTGKILFEAYHDSSEYDEDEDYDW